MRVRAILWMLTLVLAGALGWGSPGAAAKAKRSAKRPATQAAALPRLIEAQLEGKALGKVALLVNGTPLIAAAAVVERMNTTEALPAAIEGGRTPQSDVVLNRPQATVRVKPGAKEMRVDGQRVPLLASALAFRGGIYVPVEVLQALYPDHQIALAYLPQAGRVQLTSGRRESRAIAAPVQTAQRPATPVQPAAQAPANPATCGPTGGGEGVATQEFGKKGAKLEIVALLPITHGCHVRTEAELKKAYQQHQSDIHLTIADLFGSEAAKYLPQTGGGMGAVVAINGKTSFTLNGRSVTLRRQEDGAYQPSQISLIIENELKAG